MLKRKFVGIGVALALGIFVVFAWRYISAGFAVGVVVFAGLVLLANFVYLVVFKDTGVGANVRAQQFFKANGLFIIVCLFFFLVGGVYFGVVMGRVERLHDSRFLYSEVNIGGVIEEVSPTEYGKRLIVRRVEVSYAGRVSRVGSKISVHMRTDALVPLRSGYHIRLYGVRLQASEVIRFNNLNTNAIINNIHFHVWLWDAGRLEQDGSSFSLRVKDYWSYVLHTVAPPDEAGFLYALVFGDRRYLSADFVESFRYAGLLHIMAVSGLHISIFGVMLSFLLRRMRIKGWANFIVSAIIFILYAWLCSFSPSVMRAVIMSLVFIASLNLGRRTDALNTLFFAGTLILLLNPVFLFDIAFLLSFSVVFGIICLTRPIALWLSKFAGFIKGLGSDKDVVVQAKVNANIPSKKANFFAICISSSVGVLPASAHFFNYYPLLSLVSGIIVLPVLPLIYGATIVMLLLSTILIPIGFLGGFLGFIGIIFMPFRFVATYIIFMAETLAYERAELFVYSLGLLSVLFFVAIIYAGRYSPLQSRYKAVVVAVLSVVIVFGYVYKYNIGHSLNAQRYYSITRVQGGNVSVVSTARGAYGARNILVLTEEIDARADTSLQRYLNFRAVRRVDAVVVHDVNWTHARVSRLVRKLEHFELSVVYLSSVSEEDFEEFFDLVPLRAFDLRFMDNAFYVYGVRFQFFYNFPNNSVALGIVMGGGSSGGSSGGSGGGSNRLVAVHLPARVLDNQWYFFDFLNLWALGALGQINLIITPTYNELLEDFPNVYILLTNRGENHVWHDTTLNLRHFRNGYFRMRSGV